jgi:hypothetical protein
MAWNSARIRLCRGNLAIIFFSGGSIAPVHTVVMQHLNYEKKRYLGFRKNLKTEIKTT